MAPRIAFFGTPELSITALEALSGAGLEPILVVTAPDKPQGRGMQLTPPPVKVWAEANNIDVMQPEAITDEFVGELANSEWDLFVVVAYGAILPQALLDIPKKGAVNMHPSLLPKLRGASPIRSAILTDAKDAVGVTVMLLDAGMDTGPILAQGRVEVEEWPPRALLLEALLAKEGAELLAEAIPPYLNGTITPEPQNNDQATYCEKIKKEDGELDLTDDPYQNLLKIRALEGWPGTYFFAEKDGAQKRIKVVDAELAEDGSLRILRVIPEGKSETDYEEFLKSGFTPLSGRNGQAL